MTIKELLEKRARLITQAREVSDEMNAPGTTEARAAELEKRFGAMISEAEGYAKRAEQMRKLEAMEAGLSDGDPRRPLGDEARADGDPAPAAVDYRSAFHQFLQMGGDVYGLSREVRSALADGQVDLASLAPEMRAQLAGTAAAGGVLVPEDAMAPLVKAAAAFGPMWDDDFCTVLKTPGGGALPIPYVDDTDEQARDNEDEGGIASGGLSTGNDVQFSAPVLGDEMIETGWLPISVQLLSGSMPDVEGVLGGLLGERIGRKANEKLTNGAKGIATVATPSGVPVAGIDSIMADDLLALYHSVNSAYRSSPKFGAQFNDNTLLALHSLKDANGRYIVDEAPDGAGRLKIGAVSMRYRVNPGISNIGAGNRSVIIGDHGRYYVRKIGGVVLMTARDSKFQPGIGLAAYTRLDGALGDPKAIKALVHPAA